MEFMTLLTMITTKMAKFIRQNFRAIKITLQFYPHRVNTVLLYGYSPEVSNYLN